MSPFVYTKPRISHPSREVCQAPEHGMGAARYLLNENTSHHLCPSPDHIPPSQGGLRGLWGSPVSPLDRLFSSMHARNVGVANQCRDDESESVKVLVAKSSPTLVTDCSPSGSSVHGILQARILGWAAISFSRGSS